MSLLSDPRFAFGISAVLFASCAVLRGRRQPQKDAAVRERLFDLRDGAILDASLGGEQDCLLDQLEPASARRLAPALTGLEEEGTRFQQVCQCRDGRHLDIAGFVDGARARLSIFDVTAREQAAQLREARANSDVAEAARQSDILEHAPVLMWRTSPSGAVLWSNFERQIALGLHPGTLDLLARSAGGVDPAETPGRRRISVHPDGTQHPAWFEVTLAAAPDGNVLGYAIEADRIIRAEAALGRFVETLTETFAHLPIGLAIFDRDRELGLFNPALADLLRLDPAWLAGRPSLASFLNHLRERQSLPAQRDFRHWREQLVSLGRDGGTEEFAEVWVQPSGRTLRVVGRPHPQGAVAFLLEDITQAVTLEQQFREGMTLRAAALDAQPGTHMIFDVSGAATFTGANFADVIGGSVDLDKVRSPGGVHEMLRACRAQFGAAAIWDHLPAYVTGRTHGAERRPLSVPLRRDGHDAAVVELHPLPGGGTLVSFLPPPAQSVRSANSLAEAVQQALLQGRGVTEPADITIVLHDDGIGRLPCTQRDTVRRAVHNLLLVAVDCAPAGAAVDLSLARDGDAATIALTLAGMEPPPPELGKTLPVSLLRRYVDAIGGVVTLGGVDGHLVQVRVAQSALAQLPRSGPVALRDVATPNRG